jgi:hypothetical protein
VNFVVLNLKDNSGKVISHNVYWLSKEGDYRSLNELQKTTLETKVISAIKGKNETSWSIQVTNKTNKIAFFIRPQLLADGEEVLPSYWSSSYFTLAPMETATISVSSPLVGLIGKNHVLKISGWNVNSEEIKLK